MLEHYNYFEYEFEQDGAYCRARTYSDSIGEVAIFGPYSERDQRTKVEAPEMREAVMSYLKRRFTVILELRESGYATIWKRPAQ